MQVGNESKWWQRPWFWAGLLLVWLAALAWIHGYDGLYGQDAYAHLNYARDLQRHWREGTAMGSYQWPRLYAFLGALWLWGDPHPWMQVMAMTGAAVMLRFLIPLLQAGFPGRKWVAPLTFAFVGCSPLVVRNSLSVMADLPAVGLMVAALWYGHRYGESKRRLHFLLAVLLTGGAVFLRYPVALAMVVPVLVWSWQALKARDFLSLVLAVPVAAVAALPQLLLPGAAGEGLGQPFQHQHFTQWSLGNYFERSFFQKDGYSQYPVFNLGAALGMFWHPRYFGLGLAGLVAWVAWRRWELPRGAWVAMLAILIQVMFLAGIPFQNPRFLLPALPFGAILLAGSWAIGWEALLQAKWMRQVGFAAVLAVQIALGLGSCKQLFVVNANERKIASDLGAWPEKGGHRLYELSLGAMLRARVPGMDAVSMWDGPLVPPQAGDRILWNPAAFSKQFAGMWPMKNWEMLHQGHSVVEIQTWKEGWKLYEIR